jgi:hypothetical protein
MAAIRHVTDDERRARIARRHGIAPQERHPDPVSATEAMTVLHATEPASVYLSLLARIDGVTVEDIERELYERRTIVKQLAMRRTVFVFPRDLLPAAWGSASERVATQLRTRLAKEVEQHGIAEDGAAWLDEACGAVLDLLADGTERGAQAIREALPVLEGRMQLAGGKKYSANVSVSPRVLTQLGVEGHITRGRNGGHWRTSRPQWTTMAAWLGDDHEEPWKADEAWAELVRRWLWTFGPGTAADVQWWLGGTAGIVKQALATLGAEQVSLDGGETGWLLPDDLDEVRYDARWAALLPVLDPTTMGWKSRSFYLDPGHVPLLFDTNGNAGTTAWVDGRVVGCWVQDDAGVVDVRLVEKVSRSAAKALAVEATRLTAWLDGVRVSTVYPSATMKAVGHVGPA